MPIKKSYEERKAKKAAPETRIAALEKKIKAAEQQLRKPMVTSRAYWQNQIKKHRQSIGIIKKEIQRGKKEPLYKKKITLPTGMTKRIALKKKEHIELVKATRQAIAAKAPYAKIMQGLKSLTKSREGIARATAAIQAKGPKLFSDEQVKKWAKQRNRNILKALTGIKKVVTGKQMDQWVQQAQKAPTPGITQTQKVALQSKLEKTARVKELPVKKLAEPFKIKKEIPTKRGLKVATKRIPTKRRMEVAKKVDRKAITPEALARRKKKELTPEEKRKLAALKKRLAEKRVMLARKKGAKSGRG